MAKAKMKAQLRYEKKEDGREGYAINIFSDGQWGLDKWFPLVAKVGADQVGAENDKDYVHWTLLRELSLLQSRGYDIDLDF